MRKTQNIHTSCNPSLSFPSPPPFFFLSTSVGLPLLVLPQLLRGWRIVCLFSRTLECPIEVSARPFQVTFRVYKVGSLTRKRRGHRWMLLRLAFGMLPTLVVLIAWSVLISRFSDEDEGIEEFDRKWSVLLDIEAALYATITLVVAVALLCVRRKINQKELIESRAYLVFSALIVAFCCFDLVGWYAFISLDKWNGAEFSCVRIYFYVAIFVSTAGLQVYLQIRGLLRRLLHDRALQHKVARSASLEQQGVELSTIDSAGL